MINKQNIVGNPLIYYRLITLWVLNEAMLGGIIHGLKIPVSGLVVGSCAVVCISLIGWYVPRKGAIIKATIIVAVFKMMLSPHSPPPAYIAVFFQGLLGELLFWRKRFFTLSCLLLAVLALVESALQRILVLTLIYGNDLWKVINDFIRNLAGGKATTNYSLWIASMYVAAHLLTGLLVGWWASKIPRSIEKWSADNTNKIFAAADSAASTVAPKKGRRQLKTGLLIVWILLLGLYVQSNFKIGTPLLPSHIALTILLRSVIIILTWVFIIGPLLRMLLHYWLQKKKSSSQQDIQQVLQLLPSTQNLIAECWKRAANKKGWKRLIMAGKLILVNSLNSQSLSMHQQKKIFILTGAIQSGKTTSLIQWAEKRKDVFGIITPVINGKRMFMDAHTADSFDMEAMEGEKELLLVGRFVFSKPNFARASVIIRKAIGKEGWLVIDEIGPLELRGEGLHDVVKEAVMYSGNQLIILVVREGMAEKVAEFFGFKEAMVIHSISELRPELANPGVTI